MINLVWVAPDVQREIVGVPFEEGDGIFTDVEFDVHELLHNLVPRKRWWTCIAVRDDGMAMLRAGRPAEVTQDDPFEKLMKDQGILIHRSNMEAPPH